MLERKADFCLARMNETLRFCDFEIKSRGLACRQTVGFLLQWWQFDRRSKIKWLGWLMMKTCQNKIWFDWKLQNLFANCCYVICWWLWLWFVGFHFSECHVASYFTSTGADWCCSTSPRLDFFLLLAHSHRIILGRIIRGQGIGNTFGNDRQQHMHVTCHTYYSFTLLDLLDLDFVLHALIQLVESDDDSS